MKNIESNAQMSIGGLSKASGIAVETLRNWERRYGFPEPLRRKSGHRRYPIDIVPRLKLIKKAIETGYKPSFCVVTNETELRSILESTEGKSRPDPNVLDREEQSLELAKWQRAVERLDAHSLETEMQRAWLKLGAVVFINDMIIPFLREVGDRWFDRSHTVAHEHFASEITMSFLGRKWRPLSARASGPKVVLANLEGELHCLGLHMAAVFLTLYDMEIVFLGHNTPNQDILVAAREKGTTAVIIGTSVSFDPAEAAKRLRALAEEIPSNIIVAVGGNHSLPNIPGVTIIDSFEDFNIWARELSHGSISRRTRSPSP